PEPAAASAPAANMISTNVPADASATASTTPSRNQSNAAIHRSWHASGMTASGTTPSTRDRSPPGMMVTPTVADTPAQSTYACPMAPATGATAHATRRSVRFVAWVRAWRAGLIPYDDVADEIEATEDHWFAEGVDPAAEQPLREALAGFSSLHPDAIALVLPVPGDPRGLPGPGTPFTGAALVAGEGVLAGDAGLVPEVRTHTSGSGDSFSTVVWRRYPLPAPSPLAAPPPPGPTPAEAEAELTAALAEATARLTRLDVARWRPDL